MEIKIVIRDADEPAMYATAAMLEQTLVNRGYAFTECNPYFAGVEGDLELTFKDAASYTKDHGRASGIPFDKRRFNALKAYNRDEMVLTSMVVRYRQVLTDLFGGIAEQNPTLPESIPHLQWMLNTIEQNPDNYTLTKRHRWLGYVQGVMCARKIIDVQQERNETRDILQGA